MRLSEAEAKELKQACRKVENACRSLGPNCEVLFLADKVSIAPPSWPGDSTGDTLFEALQDAMETEV